MTALLALLLRLTLIYFIVKLVWSLLSGRKNTIVHGGKGATPMAGRFDINGKNVADGEYEEVRQDRPETSERRE